MLFIQGVESSSDEEEDEEEDSAPSTPAAAIAPSEPPIASLQRQDPAASLESTAMPISSGGHFEREVEVAALEGVVPETAPIPCASLEGRPRASIEGRASLEGRPRASMEGRPPGSSEGQRARRRSSIGKRPRKTDSALLFHAEQGGAGAKKGAQEEKDLLEAGRLVNVGPHS